MIQKYALFRVFKSLRDCKERFSVRSVAADAKVGVATAKRCCDYLVEQKVVRRRVIGRTHQFSIDDENVLSRHLKIAITLTEIQSAGLVQEIIKAYPNVLSIILFGSSASGRDSPDSDLDVLVVAQSSIRIRPLRSERRLSRELAIIGFSASEWRKKSVSDKVFYDNVIIGGIPLYGEMPAVR